MEMRAGVLPYRQRITTRVAEAAGVARYRLRLGIGLLALCREYGINIQAMKKYWRRS